MHKGQIKSALSFFRKAVSLENNNIAMRTNLAIALAKIPGRELESESILLEILKAEPSNHVAIHSLGVLYESCGRHKEAFECFKTCQKLTGPYADGLGYSFDVATSYLQDGQWMEGWKQYECRRRWKPEKTFDKLKTWNLEQGKKVFCWAEQGFGDTLQFSRYIPWLVDQSERVLFAVPASMYELMTPFTEICDISPLEAGTPQEAEFEIPLMSLPYLYGETIPVDKGILLKAPKKYSFSLDKDVFNVGICWAAGTTSIREIDRRVPLEDFVQLAGDSSRKLHALQADSRVKDIYDLGVQQLVQDMSPILEGDWTATRDFINSLDAVVTTDTAVAHLAAVLQKPTIMLLCPMDNWRWEYNWYPSMTILRQSKRGSWDTELRLADQLLDKILMTIQKQKAA